MDKASFKEKLLLIFFGICLSLILLEIGLRAAGAVFLYLQERHHHVSFNSNEYRILCLGESTTAFGWVDSYPSQLEKMLNGQSRSRRFTVINKGVPSITTEYILAHIDENLDRYKPQLVIVMMGINDVRSTHYFHQVLWWESIKSYLKSFRVYKLGWLIYEHIIHRSQEENTPSQAAALSNVNEKNYQQIEDLIKFLIADSVQRYHEHMSRGETQLAKQAAVSASLGYIELARRYRLQGLFQEAENMLGEAADLDPGSLSIDQEWGELYFAEQRYPEAMKVFQKVLEFDPKNTNALQGVASCYYKEKDDQTFFNYAGNLQGKPQYYWRYIELAQWLRTGEHYDLAEEYFIRALENGIDPDQVYVSLGKILDDKAQYKQEEAIYLKGISLHPEDMHLYQVLGQLYQRQGKKDLSRKYFRKAVRLGMVYYFPVTLANYRLLLDKILSRHIKVIVMQYPLRDIAPLKNRLGQRDGVTFVENKQNFKQALANGGYGHYFADNFAYDFGHCTRAGNELIARNLTSVILKQ